MCEHTPNSRHSFTSGKQITEWILASLRNPSRKSLTRHRVTSTRAVSNLLETWFAGTEGVRAVGDAVGLISIAALSPVIPTVVQLRVWNWSVRFRSCVQTWNISEQCWVKTNRSCSWSRRSRSPHNRWRSYSVGWSWCTSHWSTTTHPSHIWEELECCLWRKQQSAFALNQDE